MNRTDWAVRTAVIAESISHRLLPRIAAATLQVSAKICRKGHESAERILWRDNNTCGAKNDACYAPLANVSANVCKRLFHTLLVNCLYRHCHILHNLPHHLVGLL